MGRLSLTWVAVAALGMAAASASPAVAQTRRVQLEVLVLANGGSGTEMIMAGLDEGLVPYTLVDLNSGSRPQINAAFLTDSPSRNVKRAKFQAVVMPNEVGSLSAAELEALYAYEREFKVRQLDAYVYPSPAVGLNWPDPNYVPAYLGPLDGMTGQVTATGKTAGFGYLNGPVPFDDLSPGVDEAYGYLTTPLAVQPAGRSFTTLVEMPVPGTGQNGVLLGVLNDNGREEMVLTGSMNQYQLHQQLLFTGILNWLTYGVHFGHERNYLSVHVDDVFLADTRWVMSENCTSGDDCPPEVTAPEILMTPADVDHLVAWQNEHGIKLDMVFNGAGYDETIEAFGSYPLGTKLIQSRSQMRWINHTYTHLNVGCVKDTSVTPWRCATNSNGSIQWQPYSVVYNEINLNIRFAQQRGISIDRYELVTGEHSGLRRAPEEPTDNPNLITAVNRLNMKWLGSDNSRESSVRSVGNARTVPRYPMNIYYNVGTFEELIDEYNWIYNSKADGGSGLCEINPLSTCIPPLDLSTGYTSYLLPNEARTTLVHMLGNSPKPHYAHQSNLAEDRTLYPVLEETLAQYRALYNTNTSVVNPTQTQSGDELARQDRWDSQDQDRVSGYIQAGKLYVTHSAGLFSNVTAPITLPGSGSTTTTSSGSSSGGLLGWLSGLFGGGSSTTTTTTSTGPLDDYGTVQSGWESISGWNGKNYSLPASVGYPR